MKKLIILLVMFLPFCLKAQQAQKIAYVNVGEVMMAMPEADKAEKDLVAFRENLTKELNTMQDEFNKKYQAYVAERDSLTENIRLKRESDLTDLQQRTQNYAYYVGPVLCSPCRRHSDDYTRSFKRTYGHHGNRHRIYCR